MEIFRQGEKENVQVEVELVGDRPCGKDIDPVRMEKLIAMARRIGWDVLGRELKMTIASTDCNIPHSLGIPAVAMGICRWHGIHTREEYIEKAPLPIGLEVALRVVCALAEKEE